MSIEQKYTINLESLIDLSAKLNEKLSEEEILSSAALSLMGKFKVVRTAIFKIEEDMLIPVLSKGKKANAVKDDTVERFFLDLELNNSTLFNEGFKFSAPIRYREQILFIIALGAKADKSDLSMEEIHYLSLVLNIAANAIINARNVNSIISSAANLERRNQLLTAMFEISKDFAENVSQKEILKLFTYRLLGQLVITKFSLYYYESNSHFTRLIDRFNVHFAPESLNSILTINSAKQIKKCSDCPDLIDLEKYGVAVAAPLIMQGEVKGALLIGEKLSKEEFNEENLFFIEALGNTAISAIENARLFQDQLEKKRLESELNLAHDIQKGLLPKCAPIVDGYELFGLSYPSKHIGGDYYDFIKLDESRTLIAIADVSGKGTPASLLMANVQAALRALAPLNLSLKELVGRINSVVYHNTTADKFVTFFCGILNSKDGSFQYLSAGHNPPYLIRQSKEIIELNEGGLILGLLDNAPPYSQGEVHIYSGDAILLYTDGITEAMNLEHEEFGDENLKQVLTSSLNLSSEQISEHIVSAVRKHANGAPQSDDLTLAIIKRI